MTGFLTARDCERSFYRLQADTVHFLLNRGAVLYRGLMRPLHIVAIKALYFCIIHALTITQKRPDRHNTARAFFIHFLTFSEHQQEGIAVPVDNAPDVYGGHAEILRNLLIGFPVEVVRPKNCAVSHCFRPVDVPID